MHLRAVIFDYGEVLSKPQNQSIHRELVETTGLPLEVFETRYWANRLDYDAAILNGRTYWKKVAREAGTEFTPQQIQRLIALDSRMWMDINEPMLSWALELQRFGLRIGILSNMGEDVLRGMRQDFPWLQKFDALVWSCELGIVKPDLAIYRLAVQRLGVRPEETLFIDNLEVNVVAAERAGLHSLVYKDIWQLSRDLRRLNFDLPNPVPTVAS
jgi:putative hydrolase of the HAD superfamily